MKCLRCQHENPPQSRFCFECGARLAPPCSGCGAELPAAVKFCNQCGQATAGQVPATSRLVSPETYTPKYLAEKILTSKAALEGERKQVTILFADIKGSMANDGAMTISQPRREMDMRFWLEKAEAEIAAVPV